MRYACTKPERGKTCEPVTFENQNQKTPHQLSNITQDHNKLKTKKLRLDYVRVICFQKLGFKLNIYKKPLTQQFNGRTNPPYTP